MENKQYGTPNDFHKIRNLIAFFRRSVQKRCKLVEFEQTDAKWARTRWWRGLQNLATTVAKRHKQGGHTEEGAEYRSVTGNTETVSAGK